MYNEASTMGDFEDVFGAGANAETIISNFDRINDEEDEYCFPYPSGQNIPRALSFYEITGTLVSPRTNAFETLDWHKREFLETEAKMLVDAVANVDYNDWPLDDYAEQVSDVLVSATNRCCETVAELEAFLIKVTCSLYGNAVLVRDTSGHNGMLGLGLSTYAILLGEGFYVASCGAKPKMTGPFWFTDGEWQRNMFGSISPAKGLPGQEVLAVSKGELMEESSLGSVDTQQLVAAQRKSSRRVGDPFSFIAWHARREEREMLETLKAVDLDRWGALRAWSDRQEQNLCRLIHQLGAAILPLQARYEIRLDASETHAQISAFNHDARVSEPRASAFKVVLKLIDLSSFRGGTFRSHGFSITLLDGEFDTKSIDEVLAGREVLLDLVEDNRLDRAAVEAAIVREDWEQLVAIFCAHPIERWATRDSPQERKGIREKYWGPREKVTSQLSLAEQDDAREKLLASNLCLNCHKPKEPSRPNSSKCRACDRALPVYFSTSEALFLREAVGHFLKAEDADASPELLSVLKRLKIKVVPE
jgi:hypothetical protein